MSCYRRDEMIRFTKHIPKGRWRSFEPDYYDIKLRHGNKGKTVGSIRQIGMCQYKAYFAVKKKPTEENPAKFKMVSLKHLFKTAKEAQEWIWDHAQSILDHLNLYEFED
jgi:NADH pyrophosphatase NudC (nudix superfamily)